jgi:hypothetical protein
MLCLAVQYLSSLRQASRPSHFVFSFAGIVVVIIIIIIIIFIVGVGLSP